MMIEPVLPTLELFTHTDEAVGRFDVRAFTATEAISTLFQVKVVAHHREPGLDFLEIVGAPAAFRAMGHGAIGAPVTRTWSGIVSHIEQTRAVGGQPAYSTYELTLVPRLWLLTQRRNYRIFQYESEIQIALDLLAEWEIPVDLRLDLGSYRGRKYKVQYAETDYEFIYRILAEVGISFFFEHDGEDSILVLTDGPHQAPKLPLPIVFREDEAVSPDGETWITALRRSQRIRPNAVLLRDRDYRRDSGYELQASDHATDAERRALPAFDRRLEGFYYPENFNFLDDGVDETSPYADARGLSRTDEEQARRLARIDLQSRRNDVYVIELESNDARLTHGVTFAIDRHPADEINHEAGFLVVESRVSGRFDAPLRISCEAVSARGPYRPTLAAKPRIVGLESATVVGVAGEEIDCDEFGRVKVHFHWDRYSKRNEESSCWIPVSQTWGGAGMGGVQIPRIGHEVIVEFLAGDPDRPIITGRVFTAVNKVPLKLPAAKTQTTLQSQSTGGGGGHNMIRFEDNCGLEEVFIRAQKDMNAQILNDYSTTVGANRSATITANDTVTAHGTRTVKSGGAMTLNAGFEAASDLTATATQSISVLADKAVEVVAKSENMTLTAALALNQSCQTMTLSVKDRFVLKVGDTSMLVITPEVAILHAPQTFLNPGGGSAQTTADGGPAPKTSTQEESEKAAAEKAAEEQKRKEHWEKEYERQTRMPRRGEVY